MNGTKLYTDTIGDDGLPMPIYQPLLQFGFRWNETTGRDEPGFWTDSNDKHTTTEAVAIVTGVDLAQLQEWQRARDDEAEAAFRALQSRLFDRRGAQLPIRQPQQPA